MAIPGFQITSISPNADPPSLNPDLWAWTIKFKFQAGYIGGINHKYFRIMYTQNGTYKTAPIPEGSTEYTLTIAAGNKYVINVGCYSVSDFTKGQTFFSNASNTCTFTLPTFTEYELDNRSYSVSLLQCEYNSGYFCTYASDIPNQFQIESKQSVQTFIPTFEKWTNSSGSTIITPQPTTVSILYGSPVKMYAAVKTVSYSYNITWYPATQSNPSSTIGQGGFDYVADSNAKNLLVKTSTSATETITFPSAATVMSNSFTLNTAERDKYTCTGFRELNGSSLTSTKYSCGETITVYGNSTRRFIPWYEEKTKCIINFYYHPNSAVEPVSVPVYVTSFPCNFTITDYDDFIDDSPIANHTFMGWATTNNTTVTTTQGRFTTTIQEINYYAIWKVKHTATLTLNLSDTSITISSSNTIPSNRQPSHTKDSSTTYSYSNYTSTSADTPVSISIGADLGIGDLTKTDHTFTHYLGSDGKTYLTNSKTGTVTFKFKPSDSTAKSLTLTPVWQQYYILTITYQQGTLVGGDTLDDFPGGKNNYVQTVKSSSNKIVTFNLETKKPTTSKEYNIFQYYSVTKSGGTLVSGGKTNPSTISNGAACTYTFPNNERSATITLTANWQSQYIFTVNFYKNNSNASGTSPVTKTDKKLKTLTNPPTSYTLEIPIEYGETPFGFSRTDYEVTAWSKSTSGSNPITDEKITWEVNTSGTTYGKTINLYAIWEEAGYAWIYTSAGWKKAQPWIYCQIGSETTPSWHKARPWIFDGTEWKHT